jgi:hypothetical protein
LLVVAGELAEVSDREVDAIMERRPFLIDEYVDKKSRRARHRKGEIISAKHSIFGAVQGTVIEESATHVRVELCNDMALTLPANMIAPEPAAAVAE